MSAEYRYELYHISRTNGWGYAIVNDSNGETVRRAYDFKSVDAAKEDAKAQIAKIKYKL